MSEEIKDFFMHSIPNNVSENDIKRALQTYHIGAQRINIRERQDRTRFGFVTVGNFQDFRELKQLGELQINGSVIRLSVSRDRTKEDEEKNHRARIAVIMSQASELEVDLGAILRAPTSSAYYGNSSELGQRSCDTFHKVKQEVEQVKLANSLKVDPMTNEVANIYEVDEDPLIGAKFDDVTQAETKLDDIDSFYCNRPDRAAANLVQSFDVSSEDISRIIDDPEPIDTTNNILKSLHEERSERRDGKERGRSSKAKRSNRPSGEAVRSPQRSGKDRRSFQPSASGEAGRSYQLSGEAVRSFQPSEEAGRSSQRSGEAGRSSQRSGDSYDSWHTPESSICSSFVGSQLDNFFTPPFQTSSMTSNRSDATTPTSRPASLQTKLPRTAGNKNPQDEVFRTPPLNPAHHNISQYSSLPSNIGKLSLNELGAPTDTQNSSPCTPPIPQHSTPCLVLRPHKKKPDLPYSFRYLRSPEELDNWFQDPGDNQAYPTSHAEAPAGDYTDPWSRDTDPWSRDGRTDDEKISYSGRCGVVDDIAQGSLLAQMDNLNLEDYPPCQDPFEEVGPGFVPPAGTDEEHGTKETDEADDGRNDAISEALQLLIVFREDISKMIDSTDFEDLGGITFQVTQIFNTLLEQGLVVPAIIERDIGNILEDIESKKKEITDIEEVIAELSDAEADLVDELKEALAEKLVQLDEQKADLLYVRMANVIEFDMTMDRVSVPDHEE